MLATERDSTCHSPASDPSMLQSTLGVLDAHCPCKSVENAITAVRYPLKDHQQAYGTCIEISHPDVGIASIRTKSLRKIETALEDWALTRYASGFTPKDTPHCRRGRVGTWRFMPHRILSRKVDMPSVQDDLESFIHVVLYHSLRWINHFQLEDLRDSMRRVYGSSDTEVETSVNGGDEKMAMLVSGAHIPRELFFKSKKTHPHPLTGFVLSARRHAAKWILDPDGISCAPSSPGKFTHVGLDALFRNALKSEDWPSFDKEDQLKIADEKQDLEREPVRWRYHY